MRYVFGNSFVCKVRHLTLTPVWLTRATRRRPSTFGVMLLLRPRAHGCRTRPLPRLWHSTRRSAPDASRWRATTSTRRAPSQVGTDKSVRLPSRDCNWTQQRVPVVVPKWAVFAMQEDPGTSATRCWSDCTHWPRRSRRSRGTRKLYRQHRQPSPGWRPQGDSSGSAPRSHADKTAKSSARTDVVLLLESPCMLNMCLAPSSRLGLGSNRSPVPITARTGRRAQAEAGAGLEGALAEPAEGAHPGFCQRTAD